MNKSWSRPISDPVLYSYLKTLLLKQLFRWGLMRSILLWSSRQQERLRNLPHSKTRKRAHSYDFYYHRHYYLDHHFFGVSIVHIKRTFNEGAGVGQDEGRISSFSGQKWQTHSQHITGVISMCTLHWNPAGMGSRVDVGMSWLRWHYFLRSIKQPLFTILHGVFFFFCFFKSVYVKC